MKGERVSTGKGERVGMVGILMCDNLERVLAEDRLVKMLPTNISKGSQE